MYVYCNIQSQSFNHFCRGKAVSITYSVCVCLQPQFSSIHSACSKFPSAACLPVQYFSTLSHKWHNSGKKVEDMKCVLMLSTLFETFLFLRRIECDMIIDLYLSEYKASIIHQNLRKLVVSLHIFKKCPNLKFRENSSSGSQSVSCGCMDRWTDRQTDTTKLIVTFHNFAKCLKMEHVIFLYSCNFKQIYKII